MPTQKTNKSWQMPWDGQPPHDTFGFEMASDAIKMKFIREEELKILKVLIDKRLKQLGE